MVGARPEWVVQQALDSLLSSVKEDAEVCGTLSHDARIDAQNKERCRVRALEGGRDEKYSRKRQRSQKAAWAILPARLTEGPSQHLREAKGSGFVPSNLPRAQL
jgi:hypothetical protein